MHTLHSSTNASAASLEGWIKSEIPDQKKLEEAGLLHRLDFETSGLILAARNSVAIKAAEEALGDSQTMQKFYLAVIDGVPSLSSGGFSLHFESRYRRSKKASVSTTGAPKTRGECRWKILERWGKRTLLQVELIGPGKRHQIRAGLAHSRWPISGDSLYGGKDWSGGFGLHSWRIHWGNLTATCPPPERWNVAIQT